MANFIGRNIISVALLCSFICLVRTTPTIGMQFAANVCKATAHCASSSASIILNGGLAIAPYKPGLTRLWHMLCNQPVLNSFECLVVSLSEALQTVPHLQPIGQNILDLCAKLDLDPVTIKTLLFNGGTSVHLTFNGTLLILDPELINMTDKEKIAIIGHELVHIKDNLPVKDFCVSWIIPLALDLSYLVGNALINSGLSNNPSAHNFVNALYLLRIPLSYWLVRNYDRHYEKRADITATRLGNCAQGLIDALKGLKEERQKNLSEVFLPQLRSLIAEICNCHPPIQKRINYLIPVAHEQ